MEIWLEMILYWWTWQEISLFCAQTWKFIYIIIHSGWKLVWIFMKERVKHQYCDTFLISWENKAFHFMWIICWQTIQMKYQGPIWFLNPLYTNGLFPLVWCSKLGIVHCTSGSVFKKILYFCLNILLTYINSADLDEMQHYAAFHLGLHCLLKYVFRGSPYTKG